MMEFKGGKNRGKTAKDPARLPRGLRPLFWDCDFFRLGWTEHRDFIIGRILEHGDWKAIGWLKSRAGESLIREWMLSQKGGRLSPPQLRFWELVLELPSNQVTSWVRARQRGLWEQRTLP